MIGSIGSYVKEAESSGSLFSKYAFSSFLVLANMVSVYMESISFNVVDAVSPYVWISLTILLWVDSSRLISPCAAAQQIVSRCSFLSFASLWSTASVFWWIAFTSEAKSTEVWLRNSSTWNCGWVHKFFSSPSMIFTGRLWGADRTANISGCSVSCSSVLGLSAVNMPANQLLRFLFRFRLTASRDSFNTRIRSSWPCSTKYLKEK